MKSAVVLIALCLSCCAFAQTEAPDEYYSHLSVVVEGEPCTVIGPAWVQDGGGSKWVLPKVVLPNRRGEPCPTRVGYKRQPVTLTVIARSDQLGAILSKPGPMMMGSGSTAGWYSAKTNGIAKPGLSRDERCQRAIHGNKPLRALLPGEEVQPLVPITSGGGIDVYAGESSFRESVQATPSDGSFWADIIFVYRDEGARQRAIQEITANNPKWVWQDSLTNLKYVWMRVAYYPTIYLGPNHLPNGETLLGPVLSVGVSDYIEPGRCTEGGFTHFENKDESFELVFTRDDRYARIGSENGFVQGCTNCNSWSLLAGDLTPLRTAAGEDVIRVDKQRSPFLVQVIDAMEQRLAAARQNPDGKDSAK